MAQYPKKKHKTQNPKQSNQKEGKRPKELILQRHKDSQQAHEKMLHIINYSRNTNQNYNEGIISHQ